jgi:hypothetical protein
MPLRHPEASWFAAVVACAVAAAATALAFGGGTTGYEKREIVEIPRTTPVIQPEVAPVTVERQPEPQTPPPPRMKPPIDP